MLSIKGDAVLINSQIMVGCGGSDTGSQSESCRYMTYTWLNKCNTLYHLKYSGNINHTIRKPPKSLTHAESSHLPVMCHATLSDTCTYVIPSSCFG